LAPTGPKSGRRGGGPGGNRGLPNSGRVLLPEKYALDSRKEKPPLFTLTGFPANLMMR
jgi:hypothetical protein